MRYGIAAEFAGQVREREASQWITNYARNQGVQAEVEDVHYADGDTIKKQAPRHLTSTGRRLEWGETQEQTRRLLATVEVGQDIDRFVDQAAREMKNALSQQGARDVNVSIYKL